MAANVFYHFDGDPEDEAAWQAFVSANSTSDAETEVQTPSSSTALKTLYELFLLFVVFVALVGTVLWQKDTTQISALEAEVQTLEEALVRTEARQQSTAAAPLLRASRLPVYEVIETDYLRFIVQTEQLVIDDDIASKLDRAYGALSSDLGLQVDPLGEKVNLLVVDGPTNDEVNLYTELGVIVIDVARSKAAIASDPQMISQENYNNLYGQLMHRLLLKALLTREIRPVWGIVITHLDTNLQQSEQPLSAATLSAATLSAATLPAYKVQQRELAQMVSLGTALLQREPGDWMYPDYALAHAVTDSVVEYILVTYGRDAIPALLDAMTSCDDWNELIPAVFAIPADQFTTEWHAYLQGHYPIDDTLRN